MNAAVAHSPPRAAQPPAPSRALDELERSLTSLIEAHAELAEALDRQHEAMKVFDTEQMARLVRRQEQLHRRILRLESDRRKWAQLAASAARLASDAALTQIAAAYPDRAQRLLELREALRSRSRDAAERSRRCQRIAGSVLAHLSGALRLLTRSSLYRSNGDFSLPPPTRRLEATG